MNKSKQKFSTMVELARVDIRNFVLITVYARGIVLLLVPYKHMLGRHIRKLNEFLLLSFPRRRESTPVKKIDSCLRGNDDGQARSPS